MSGTLYKVSNNVDSTTVNERWVFSWKVTLLLANSHEHYGKHYHCATKASPWAIL